VIAISNGMIEAVCNPLTATLYPDRKAGMLNRMHMWFPGGIVLGGLGCWALDQVHADWRAKMIMVLIPALAYGVIFLREKFPPTRPPPPARRCPTPSRPSPPRRFCGCSWASWRSP